jgi:hypothetical protein
MKKRIKHNNLLPWFTDDHNTLPAAYLKSTKKFFDGLQATSRVGPPYNVQGHKEKK